MYSTDTVPASFPFELTDKSALILPGVLSLSMIIAFVLAVFMLTAASLGVLIVAPVLSLFSKKPSSIVVTVNIPSSEPSGTEITAPVKSL